VTQVDLRQEWGVEVGNAGGATVFVKQTAAAAGPVVNSDRVDASVSSGHEDVEPPKDCTRPEEASETMYGAKSPKLTATAKKLRQFDSCSPSDIPAFYNAPLFSLSLVESYHVICVFRSTSYRLFRKLS
jgi:hypothetical protein